MEHRWDTCALTGRTGDCAITRWYVAKDEGIDFVSDTPGASWGKTAFSDLHVLELPVSRQVIADDSQIRVNHGYRVIAIIILLTAAGLLLGIGSPALRRVGFISGGFFLFIFVVGIADAVMSARDRLKTPGLQVQRKAYNEAEIAYDLTRRTAWKQARKHGLDVIWDEPAFMVTHKQAAEADVPMLSID